MISAARRRPLSILAQSAASPTDPLSLRCSSYFLRDGRNDRQSTAGSQRRRITPAQVVGFCVGLQPSQCTPLLLRSFATSRQRRAAAAKKDGADEKVPTPTTTASSSIHGKRPGQTPFSPTKSAQTTLHRPNQDLLRNADATFIKNKSNNNTPLILPPSVSKLQVNDEHLNKDNFAQAHSQPSATQFGQNPNDTNNPLHNLFLQQGIIPQPSRPTVSKSANVNINTSNIEPPIIPEPHPSGVSHANPEDILDLASMYDPSIHLPDKPNFSSPTNRAKYEGGTPMTDELIAYIGVRGPITVAEFMRRVLRDGRYGYYTSKGSRSGKKIGVLDTKLLNVSGTTSEETVSTIDDVDDDNDWDLDDEDDLIDTNIASNDDDFVGGEQVIGAAGDFITAPEVSQLFGESLLVWLMTQYQSLGSPSKIQLIEIGPGKGTLMCDIVRSAIATFPDFASALTSPGNGYEGGEKRHKVCVGVHLVEVTNGMRSRQKESIRNLQKETSVVEKGYTFHFSDDEDDTSTDSVEVEPPDTNNQTDKNVISFEWHDVLSSVPIHDDSGDPIPTFVICQELVDALPIHSFQKIEGNLWRERLVDVAIRDDSEASDAAKDVHLAVARRYANAESCSASPDSATLEPTLESKKKLPRLRFVLPPDTTPALRTLLRVNGNGAPSDDNHASSSLNSLPVGSIIEACPEGLILVQDIADRIQNCNGGAALIIDYGENGASGGDTLRGFWRHTQVHPLSRPGEVDVTADVDFGALREAVNRRVTFEDSFERKRKENAYKRKGKTLEEDANENDKPDNKSTPPITRQYEAYGPITQGQFLASMGIVERVERYIEDDDTTDEQAYELFSALERLVGSDEMGERYKVLAIAAAKKDDLFPPPGF